MQATSSERIKSMLIKKWKRKFSCETYLTRMIRKYKEECMRQQKINEKSKERPRLLSNNTPYKNLILFFLNVF